MLLLRSYPNSMFMGSALSHSESIKGNIRKELDPPIWNFERSVHSISRYANCNLMDGPNGVPLFCTSRGCRPAHVSESEYISGGSGIHRRGENCAAAEDENSKRRTDMYYQSMFEANPGNPLLLSTRYVFVFSMIEMTFILSSMCSGFDLKWCEI